MSDEMVKLATEELREIAEAKELKKHGFVGGFKKTAGKKKNKLRFSPMMSQKEICKYIDKKSDHVPKTGYAEGPADQYVWHFEKSLPLEFAKAIKKDWLGWFQDEQDEWKYNHGPYERSNHFDKWSDEPELKPIIVVKGTDGRLHIWDGHHRIGKCLTIGKKEIPAIVGVRKDGKSDRGKPVAEKKK